MASLFLTVAVVILAVILLGVAIALLNAKRKLVRFASINDVEEAESQLRAQVKDVKLTLDSYTHELAKSKAMYAKYTEMLGELKSIEQAKQTLAAVRQQITEHNDALGNARTCTQIKNQASKLQADLSSARAELNELQPALEIAAIGIYKRQYHYSDPASFKRAIEACVGRQKEAAKLALQVTREPAAAVTSAQDWQVEGSAEKGRAMILEQIKLSLRAFNGDADACIAKVKHGNFGTIEKRLYKSFEVVNKLGETKGVAVTSHYLQLRMEELVLNHELEQAKEAEKQQQRELREEMREQAKVEREIASAQRKAEIDEKNRRKEIEDLRRQAMADSQNAELRKRLIELEQALLDTIAANQRAISQAQLTRRGCIYVISNVGSFGENVFKIGMTRRLVPEERVNELSDASVPFAFNIHAMIQCDDAPALETKLHQRFNDARVNKVNLRKEFFSVPLASVEAAVNELHNGEIVFEHVPDASEYFETLAINKENQANTPVAVPVAG